MVKNLNKLAREILERNQYMTIASTDGQKAWASPVVYAYDKDYNFYFVSIPESRHGKNINQNHEVAIAIFDSHQLYGEGVGLQIEGSASKIEKKAGVLRAAAIYYKRKYPYRKILRAFDAALQRFLARKIYSFYKIIPTKVLMNNPNSQIDERIEINLANA